MPDPTTPILDNFTRSNESPLAGGWLQTPIWSGQGLCEINSNQCRSISSVGNAVWGVSAAENQESYISIPAVTNLSLVELYIRGTNFNTGGFTNTYIQLGCRASDWRLQMEDSDSNVVNTTQALSAGDCLWLQAIGDTAKAYYKASGGSWVEKLSMTTTKMGGGLMAFLLEYSGVNNPRIGSFGGGNIITSTMQRGKGMFVVV